jgi:hypothetical protein
MKLRFPQQDELSRVAELPMFAVDLGFAKTEKKSCGLAWQKAPDCELKSGRSNFGQCINEVAEFLAKNSESVLVVEAPLSGLFDSEDNPKPRLCFEKSDRNGQTRHRYWYVGAGAAVGLGAAFFFTNLSRRLSQDSVTINVVEGFISFKEHPTDDEKDAIALLKSLRAPRSAKIHNIVAKADESERSVNMLSLSGLASPEDPCPMVIDVVV